MQSQQLNYFNIGLAAFSIFGLLWNKSHSCYGFPMQEEDEPYFPNLAATAGAPVITPLSEDLILEVNTNFTLKCESNTPVIWKLPHGFELASSSAEYETRDPERPYGSQLVIINITGENVGYYYCVKANAYKADMTIDEEDLLLALVEDLKAASIYIFVNDVDNLLVPSEQIFLTGFQYSDIIIPCKPTMPETVVELTTTYQETHSSEHAARYDPKRGFAIQLQNILDSGDYICRPKHPSVVNPDEEIGFHVKLSAATDMVKKPNIYSASKGHAKVGESFELLCKVEMLRDVLFNMTWEIPPNSTARTETRVSQSNVAKENHENSFTEIYGVSTLFVENAAPGDTGNYICKVVDRSNKSNHNKYFMKIMGQNESYINIKEPGDHYTITTNALSVVTMLVNYKGYPLPSLTWYRPDNTIITPTKKYLIERKDDTISLKIKDVELKDSGSYVLVADNGILRKDLKFNVSIKDKPNVQMESVYVQAGEDAIITCKTESFPAATVKWAFVPCSIQPTWPTCEEKAVKNFNSTRRTANGDTEYKQTHILIFKPEQPGIVKCYAYNSLGSSLDVAEVLIGDLIDNMTVYGIDEGQKIASGDEVTLTCAALAYYYSADIMWYKKNVPVDANDDIQIISTFSEFSYKTSLKFKSIKNEHNGSYECRAHFIQQYVEYDSKFMHVEVFEPEAPLIEYTNMEKEHMRIRLGEQLGLECKATGIPKPTVTWYKDDSKINTNTNVSIEENNTVLRIPFIKPENEGIYKCVISNRLGSVERSTQVMISNMPGLRLGWILGIVVILLILIVLVIYLWIRVKRERALRKEMRAAGLANFEEGAVEHINPALTLDEQADLLPYDKRFEFPRNKLRLGKQLGAGAFGVVLKASAEGINPDEKETIVAVKMVKRTADNEVMKALVSELKIMVHLGQHLNVVNLLGAVTKNIAKREVMVIVEYCRFGNVQNYLLKNRKRFINQINLHTDLIDPTIMDQRYSGDYEYNSNNRSDNDPRSGTRAGRPNSRGYLCQSDLYDGNVDTCNTEQTVMTTIPEGEDQVLSNNSVQPAWRSNYKTDTSEVMEITTTHLISWAFQVARGMDYLASRKVLHGDLAARNILLCEDNVVKICDFGLARSMYKSDNYKKQGDAPLPIKWLALESLSDQVFSTYTDVWSFGIVLWELFSLAKVPYPGMDADQIYLKLKDGYRMQKPPYANQELYDIMLECWSTNPESRPLFNELERKFARLLEDDVTNHYLDLNEPYLRTNNEYFQNKDTDYLAMMGPPDMMAPSPPRYVNGKILPEIKIEPTDEYLKMSPKTEQNSPTISNNLDSPISKNRKKTAIPEEIPMLKHSSGGGGSAGQSDSDAEFSPDPITNNRSFTNLNRTPSPIEAETKLSGDDSYVNVKAIELNKNSYLGNNGTRDAFSNPSYLMLKSQKKNEKFY